MCLCKYTTDVPVTQCVTISVFSQGDKGTSWYIIWKGSVNVITHGKVNSSFNHLCYSDTFSKTPLYGGHSIKGHHFVLKLFTYILCVCVCDTGLGDHPA